MHIVAVPSVIAIVLLAAGVAVARPLPAQAFPEPFSGVPAVRELSDGRTLAFDWKEKRLMVLDWSSGQVRDIGRVGDGPGEYQGGRQLLALPGDTTALVDPIIRRWVLLHRDRVLATLTPEQSLHLMQFFSPPLGADAEGQVLVVAAVPWTGPGERAVLSRMPQWAESLLVLRLRREGGRIDTVAGLRGRPWGASRFTRGSGRERMAYTASNPLSAPEQALMLEDGTVVVARQHPFRLEVIARDGSRHIGPILDSTRLVASPRERQAAIARSWAHVGPPPLTEADFEGWPELVPHFPMDALLHVPGNRVAVRRQRSAAFPLERIDIVDASGHRIRQVHLRDGESVVAFGRRHMYVVHTDGEGFTILSRREW